MYAFVRKTRNHVASSILRPLRWGIAVKTMGEILVKGKASRREDGGLRFSDRWRMEVGGRG